MKPLLLDLYCKAGGAGKGYAEAGFDVVGVDIEPQPNYPFKFIQADALEVLRELRRGFLTDEVDPAFVDLTQFDAIHASPPCQASSKLRTRHPERDYPELIPPTRELLLATGLPYVIENVEGAKLVNPTTLCGSSFGLGVRRHRLFETSFPIAAPRCAHRLQPFAVPVYGHSGSGANRGVEKKRGRKNGVAEWREAMGIDWMTGTELAQAIPPRLHALPRPLPTRLRRTLRSAFGGQLDARREQHRGAMSTIDDIGLYVSLALLLVAFIVWWTA